MLAGAVKIACIVVAGLAVTWLWDASGRIIPAPRSHRCRALIAAAVAVTVFAAVSLAG